MGIFLVLSLIVLFVLIYQCFFGHLRNFDRQGITGPIQVPIFGTLWSVWYKNAHEVLLEDYKKYGDMFRTYHGSTPCLNISDPHLIQAVLKYNFTHFMAHDRRTIKSQNGIANFGVASLTGPTWKAIRGLVTSSLAPARINENMTYLNTNADKLVAYWRFVSKYRGKFDVQIESQCWSMELMSKLLFSLNADIIGNQNHAFLKNAKQETSSPVEGILSTLLDLYPQYSELFSKSTGHDGHNYFVKIYQDLFLTRENSNDMNANGINDMVDILINKSKYSRKQQFVNTSLQKERANIIVAQLVASTIGFHEIGSLISRVLHCMAINPETQELARAEVTRSIHQNNGVNTFGAVSGMSYLEQCINETLRLYPLNYRIARACNEDIQYDKIFIKAGTSVRIPIYAINRDPKHYPDPERFDPGRFSPEQISSRHSALFIPFGDGPRECPAKRMIFSIVKFCVSRVLENFRFSQINETINPLPCTSGLSGSLAVTGEMWLGIESIK